MGALPDVTGDPRDQLAAAFRSWLSFAPEDRPTMKELAEQLEVLLEPDAEEVRQEEKRHARQARTILGLQADPRGDKAAHRRGRRHRRLQPARDAA